MTVQWWQMAAIVAVAFVAGANVGLLIAGMLHAASTADEDADRQGERLQRREEPTE